MIKEIAIWGSELDKRGELVYFSRIPEANAKLIIYPNDDLVELGKIYSVAVNRIVKKQGRTAEGTLLLCEISHEFKIGDDINVRLSGVKISPTSEYGRRDFTFKLHKYFGYLRGDGSRSRRICSQLKIGDYVRARVLALQEISGIKDIIQASPLEKLVAHP